MLNAVIMILAIVFHHDGTVTSRVATAPNTAENMETCKEVAEAIYDIARSKDEVARVSCQVVTSSPTTDASSSN